MEYALRMLGVFECLLGIFLIHAGVSLLDNPLYAGEHLGPYKACQIQSIVCGTCLCLLCVASYACGRANALTPAACGFVLASAAGLAAIRMYAFNGIDPVNILAIVVAFALGVAALAISGVSHSVTAVSWDADAED